MRLFLLSIIAGSALACPALAQDWLDQVASATRAATIRPASGSFVGGAQVYAFADDVIFEGYVTPGLVTDLALQPGEALVAVASGGHSAMGCG